MNSPTINEHQRRALLALMDVEAARLASGQRERRTARHRLFALVRMRFGCKYSCLGKGRFREAAHWLIDGPLDTSRENGYL